MGKEIHTKTGYFTDGTYIKYKSGYTKNWKVETVDDTFYFDTEAEADEFTNILTTQSDEKQH